MTEKKESILKIDDLDFSDELDQEGLAEVSGGRLLINKSKLNNILKSSGKESLQVTLHNQSGKPFEIINRPEIIIVGKNMLVFVPINAING